MVENNITSFMMIFIPTLVLVRLAVKLIRKYIKNNRFHD